MPISGVKTYNFFRQQLDHINSAIQSASVAICKMNNNLHLENNVLVSVLERHIFIHIFLVLFLVAIHFLNARAYGFTKFIILGWIESFVAFLTWNFIIIFELSWVNVTVLL